MQTTNRSAHFDYTTLHAQIPLKHSDFVASYSFFFDGDRFRSDRRPADLETVRLHLDRVTAVEHEYFHCRHLLASTFGLAIHLLSIIEQDQKEYFAEARMSREFFVSSDLNTASLENARKFGFSKDWFEPLCFFTYWTLLRRLFLVPNRENFQAFAEWQDRIVRLRLGKHERPQQLISLNLAFPRAPYLRNIRRMKGRYLRDFPVTRAVEVLEAIAVWREYLYVSHLAIFFPAHFATLTNNWVDRALAYDTYRVAPDAILKATGCNLSTALAGVILDIALCGPFFTEGNFAFAELHPCWRLALMLELSGDLPRHLRELDNLERIGDEFYSEIECFFRKRLGWRPVAENLKDAVAFIDEEIKHQYHTDNAEGKIGELLRRLNLSRFFLPMAARKDSISAFLFLSERKEQALLGYQTQPLITWFSDRLVVGAHVDFRRPDVVALYLSKIGIVLASRDFLDDLPGESPERFRDAREFLSRAQELFLEGELKSEIASQMLAGGFDRMMSDWLGFNWKEACRERSLKGLRSL